MARSKYNLEEIAHIRVNDRDFNVYISIAYNTATLHMFKYDNFTCEYEWFTVWSEAKEWIQRPIRRADF